MFSVASVRGRKWSFAGSFAALTLGVAILSTTLLVFAGAQRQVPQRFQAADVMVHGPVTANGFTSDARPWPAQTAEALAGRLAAVPGVRHAVADRSFYAQIRDGGLTEGNGWSSTLLAGQSLVDGRAPQREGEVATDGAKTGDRIEMLTAKGPVPVTVVGVVNGPGIYVSDAWAAALSPGVKTIGLVTGGERVDLSGVELDGGLIATGDDRSIAEPETVARIRWLGAQLLIAMAMLGAFATVFVVSSTFALAASQRRRELGLLRTIGATGRQVRRLILGEAVVVGVAGAGLGALSGLVFAPLLARLLFAWGLEPFPEVPIKPWPVPVAWLTGLAVAVAGAWSASRRAGRVGPLEVLRESAVERRLSKGRMVFGGLVTLGGVLLALATASSKSEDRVGYALFTTCVLIFAAALLSPVLIRPVVRLMTWPLRGPAALVVRGEMLTALRRNASLMAPVIATVGFTAMLTGMVATMLTAYPNWRADELKGMTVVVPREGVPGLSDEAVAAAGPGRSSIEARVSIGARLLEIEARADVPAGSIAIDGHEVGSTVQVTFADGQTVAMRVADPGDSLEDALVNRDELRSHDATALTREVVGGAAAGPGARVLDAYTYARDEAAFEGSLLWLFSLVLIGLSVGYTALAVLNTMGMATAGRRRDFAVLRAAGATGRQVLRFALTEMVLVVAAGAVLGLAVTVPPLLAMVRGLEEETGLAVSLALHWPSIAIVTFACLAAASAGTILNLRGAKGVSTA